MNEEEVIAVEVRKNNKNGKEWVGITLDGSEMLDVAFEADRISLLAFHWKKEIKNDAIERCIEILERGGSVDSRVKEMRALKIS